MIYGLSAGGAWCSAQILRVCAGACTHTHRCTSPACAQTHLHAGCLMVCNLKRGLLRSSHQRAAWFPGLSFLLSNQQTVLPDADVVKFWVTEMKTECFLSFLLPNKASLHTNCDWFLFFSFFCGVLDCSLPKCESKLDGPGQTSGRPD